jgi:hypothetical protein
MSTRLELLRLANELEALETRKTAAQQPLDSSMRAHADGQWLAALQADADKVFTLLQQMRKPLNSFYQRMQTLELYERELMNATELKDIYKFLEKAHIDSLSAHNGANAFNDVSLSIRRAQDQIDAWNKKNAAPAEPAVDDADAAEWAARMEERQHGHRDRDYWG